MATVNRWDNDGEFEQHTIVKVEGKPGEYFILFDGSLGIGCPSDFEPRPGDEAILFGRGIGYPVRGLIVGGREVWYRTPEEEQAKAQADREEYERKQALVPKRPPVTAFGRTFSHDMREISGFGGGYETCCRAMVLAGVEWLSKHSGERPKIGQFGGIIGVHINENESAKHLEDAILAAEYEWEGAKLIARNDCSGAMVQYSINHAIRANAIGWEAYVVEMRWNCPVIPDGSCEEKRGIGKGAQPPAMSE